VTTVPNGRAAFLRPPAAVLLLALTFGIAATNSAAAQPAAQRPNDAPRLGGRPALAALPAEYLTHERSGLRFSYHPSARDRVRGLLETAEDDRRALREELGEPVLASVEIRVAVHDADFARIMPKVPDPNAEALSEDPPRTGPGPATPHRRWRPPTDAPILALSDLNLIVMNLDAIGRWDGPGAAESFRHALAHLALDDAIDDQPVPHWLHAGFAAYGSNRAAWSRTIALGWASLRRDLPPIRDLDWRLSGPLGPETLGTAQAADIVRFMTCPERRAAFRKLVGMLGRGEPFSRALPAAYGVPQRDLEQRWRRNLAWRSVFVPLLIVGLLVAGLVALTVYLSRRREDRRARQRQADGPVAAHHHSPARVAVIRVDRSEDEKLLADAISLSEPPGSGVPKVSHKGQWHTLH